jgi:hypothetical protein
MKNKEKTSLQGNNRPSFDKDFVNKIIKRLGFFVIKSSNIVSARQHKNHNKISLKIL